MATTLTEKNLEFLSIEWENTRCPFCNADDFKSVEKFGYEHRYEFVRCQKCSLAYQNHRPKYDSEFTETAYEVYSLSDPFTEGKGTDLTTRGKLVHAEYSFTLKELEELGAKRGRLLEVGCNTGFFCKVAKDQGWEPIGVEISKSMAEIARTKYGFETRSGDWLPMHFEKPFDAIYCSHVIEHIPNPSEWLKRFAEVLAPNGILCISVPNFQSIDRRFKRFLKNVHLRKDHWAKWRTPDHLYEPCEKSILQFFDRNGYEVLRHYSYPSEWLGERGIWHRLFHFNLRWGAKSRYFIKPKLKDRV